MCEAKTLFLEICDVNELFKEILISDARPRGEWKQGLKEIFGRNVKI